MTYSSLSKRFPKHNYFCGWYYRCQSNRQTLGALMKDGHISWKERSSISLDS